MKFIGNYLDWVTPEVWNVLINTNGDTVPVWQPDRWRGTPMLDHARERARPGYSDNKHFFQQFNKRTVCMENLITNMPIPLERKFCTWWFIKLLPGQMQFMHVDPHVEEEKNVLRYTMFLSDYTPGHIFVYEGGMTMDYKAGDLYLWDDPMSFHGVCNIGFENRYTFQLTMHD